MSDDRRKHERAPVRRMGQVVVGGLARKLSVIDISMSGFSGLAEESVPKGAVVLAEIPLGQGEPAAKLAAEVCWSSGRFFGARFRWLEPDASAAVTAHLRRHEELLEKKNRRLLDPPSGVKAA